MKILLRLVRIASLTLAAFCALPGIGALAQTTTYTVNGGYTSNGYYSYDGIPLVDQSGNKASIWIFEGANSNTGAPYSWVQFQSGAYQGLMAEDNTEAFSEIGTPASSGPRPATFPPACEVNGKNYCFVITDSFVGAVGSHTYKVNMSLNVYFYRACGARTCIGQYEIYGGTVSVSE